MKIATNTTTLRLTPVKAFLQLQHTANHYKNIINPRKINSHQTSREQQRDKICSGYLHNKFDKFKVESIQQQNLRIVKDCRQIYRNSGILEKAEHHFRTLQNTPKTSLINNFKVKQKMEQLKKQNLYLKKKLESSKPLIGDKEKWKKHQAFTLEMANKLQHKTKSQSYNTDTIVKIALSCQKQKMNYLKLFKTFHLEQRDSQHAKQTKTKTSKTKKRKRTSRSSKISKPLLECNQNEGDTVATKTAFQSQFKQNSQSKQMHS